MCSARCRSEAAWLAGLWVQILLSNGCLSLVSIVCCVGSRPLRWAGHSFRGVLPNVCVYLCVIWKPWKRGGLGTSLTVAPKEGEKKELVGVR